MSHSTDLQRTLLHKMLYIRRFEERAGQLYGLRKIGGFCHLYIGEEAVAVGAISALDMTRDYVLAAYREHGHAIAAGMDGTAIMAELLGKETGCSRGKGGSMHLFDADGHFLGGNGIVGAHLPVAAGVALRIRYLDEDGVVLCFFGDGAIHQGAFHEALNLAGIWNLPVIYICENNRYGMGTDYRRVSSQTDFAEMAKSYSMVGKTLDGMDVEAMYSGISELVQTAREEKRPALVEAQTYRFVGHSMSDPAKYRTREELDEYRQGDPILILKDRMISDGALTEEEYETLDGEIKAEIKTVVADAEAAAEPAPESLYEDVLAGTHS